MVLFIVFLIVAIVVFFKLKSTHKVPKLADVSMITGGVKTGKSTLAVYLAIKKYKSNLFKWRVKSFVKKILRKDIDEKPLLYSNIPLKYPYVPLTREVFMREVRPSYKSVALCDEASLIADAMDWRCADINESLKMFNKLWGHETRGGSLFYDTQVMKDVHYSIKRSMNNYLWIHHAIKWIPFIYVVRVREMFFSEDGENVNISEKDVEDSLMWLIVPKKIWKIFDCYCYSILTDHLPIKNDIIKNQTNLKTDYIIQIKGDKK